MAPQFIKSPWTGAAGFLASVGWESFWLIGPPVGIDASNRRAYLFWGLVALVISAVQAFGTLLRRAWVAEAKLEPKFHLQFDAADRTNTYVEANYSSPIDFFRRYRFAVINESGVDLVGLSAVVVAVSGTDRIPIERRLRPMAEAPESDGYFTVPRDGRRFVNAIYEHGDPNRPDNSFFRVSFNSDGLARDVKTPVSLVIHVLGANAPAQSVSFNVALSHDRDKLSVRESRG